MKSVKGNREQATASQVQTYVIATSREWNEGMPVKLAHDCELTFELITDKSQLTIPRLDEIRPRFIFFPHWSYIIPEKIFSRYECVIFHMTDLPFGRGGSPLQNLISRGHTETLITALRCVKELDGGPIYMKRPLSLNGTAEEIYLRASREIELMIKEMIQVEPTPEPQTGEPVIFRRRTPDQSEITDQVGLVSLFDHFF